MYNKNGITEEYIGNIKRCVVTLLLATSVSFVSNVDYKNVVPALEKTENNAENYERYSYDSEKDTMVTNAQWIRGIKSTNSKGDAGTVDRVYDKQTLIEKLNSNIGERECVTDPNFAVEIVDKHIEISGDYVKVSITIKNNLPIDIKKLNCIAVVHNKGKSYFNLPVRADNMQLKPYECYKIEESVKLRDTSFSTESNISLVAAYMQ